MLVRPHAGRACRWKLLPLRSCACCAAMSPPCDAGALGEGGRLPSPPMLLPREA